jgi:transposase
MITLPSSTQIWIAAGVTDLRRGFMGLSALVQSKLEQSPMSGQVFVFRGRRGDLIKLLWFEWRRVMPVCVDQLNTSSLAPRFGKLPNEYPEVRSNRAGTSCRRLGAKRFCSMAGSYRGLLALTAIE